MPIVISGTNGISGVDGTASNPSYEGTDANTGVFFPAADTVAIGTNGTEALRVNSAGNLLVGTTTTTNNLRLNEKFAIVHAGSATYAGMAITGYSGTSGGARPLFEMQRSRGTTDGSMTKVESGDVIGSLIFRGSDGSAFQDVAEISVAVDGATGASDTPGRITFATSADGSSSPTERMRLDASGNLCVGTTSAISKITLEGASDIRLTVRESGSAVRTDVISQTTQGQIGTVSNHPLDLITNGTGRARIDTSGNLLVGQTSKSQTTVGAFVTSAGEISGCQSASTNGITQWTTYSTGAAAYRFYVGMGGTVFATSTTISAISDIRFKENVQDLDVGLDAVMALKPRKFDWKEGKGKDIKGDRGWIAQEFEQVFPDMVDTWMDEPPEGEEPYKSVGADLIPVLVKAIQEQQQMIETLQAKVAALEAK